MIDQCGDMPYLSDVGAREQAHRMHDPRLVCLVHLSGVHAPHTFDSLVVDAGAHGHSSLASDDVREHPQCGLQIGPAEMFDVFQRGVV